MSQKKSYQVWTCPLVEDINSSKNISKSQNFKTKRQATEHHNSLSIGSHTFWIGRIK